MGKARLNVWIRDENFRVIFNNSEKPQWDWVEVRDCTKELVRHVDLPVGEAHVEIEVPPGCYEVQGHICLWPQANFNNFTDKAIVVIGCHDEVCVNLVTPLVQTCVFRDIHPFLREALELRLPTADVVTTARTMLTAGKIQPRQAFDIVKRMIEECEAKKAEKALKEFTGTLEILEKLM